MSTNAFQVTNIRYIKRIVVGNDNPQHMKTESEVEEAMALVNRCVSATPRGYIMNVEKSFGLYNVGEHQIVLQYAVYHIGFERKPLFIDENGPS